MIKYEKPFSKFWYVVLQVYVTLNTVGYVYLQLVSLLDNIDDSLVTNSPFEVLVTHMWICFTI